MKNLIILLLSVGLLGVGFLCFKQNKAGSAELSPDRSNSSEPSARKSNSRRLFSTSLGSSGSARRAGPASDKNATPATARPANFFQDPEIQEILLSEHASGQERRLENFFSQELLDRLDLSPEKLENLRRLTTENQEPYFELMLQIMLGELDGPQRAEAGRRLKEQQEKTELEIRNLLSPEQWAVYHWHETSQGDRASLETLKTQFARTREPLQPAQEEQLLFALYEERVKTPFTTSFDDPKSIDFERFSETFSPANLDRHFEEMKEMNKRVEARTATFLSPTQTADLRVLLQNQLNKSHKTVKLTQRLMGQ